MTTLTAPADCLPEVRAMLEHVIAARPEEARAALRLPADGPIGWREADELKLAWLRSLDLAVAVRCHRRCPHTAEIAVPRLQIVGCGECIEEMALQAARLPEGERGCDVCGKVGMPVKRMVSGTESQTVIVEVCASCAAFEEKAVPDA